MQAKHHDGSYGDVKPLTSKNLEEALANPNVAHVEVFEPTPENLEYRKKFLGAKKRSYKKPKK